jgi:sigma-E factor negative regulatory protein RseC
MIEALAVVVKVEGQQVWIESGQQSACGSCQQQASCASNAVSGAMKSKSVAVDCGMALKVGDEVMVAIDEKHLLHASLLLYFVPLIAMFTGAGLADWLLADNAQYADLWEAGSAMVALMVSLYSIHKTQKQVAGKPASRPAIVRKA